MDNKKQHIKSLFNEFTILPFPQVENTVELQNLKGELASYDGHVAGLVSSYLNGSSINGDLVRVNSDLELEIQNFSPSNSLEQKNINELEHYKHKLDELVAVLLDCLNL